MKSRLFEYAVLWHPTEKQVKEESMKSKLISAPVTVMAINQEAAMMAAAMSIPKEYKDQLDQVEIAMRPF
jgi:hypothetical protein